MESGVEGGGAEGERPAAPDLSQLCAAIERLVEGQAALQRALAHHTTAAGSGGRGGAAEHGGLGVETGLDYQDSWPEVEVTIAVNKIEHFDLAELSFDADFFVFLDWVDHRLQRGVHYNYNAEVGSFEMAKTLRRCDGDDRKFFNPGVFVENTKTSGDDLLRDSDEIPSILDEITRDGVDVPWLTRKFHFMGGLSCREADARYFPFDLERLQIRIASRHLEGVTSAGKERDVHLVEPSLRTNWRLNRKRDPLPGWAYVRQPDVGMSHWWRVDDDGAVEDVGEMQLLAIGGVETMSRTTYAFYIVLRRHWFPRYVLDFAIISLQVVAAAASLWVPFTPDMLANRMSITLTVLLTLVSASGARPPVIESLHYPTLHDHYGQLMVFFVASVVGIANLFVFVSCWGMYRHYGPGQDSNYDYYDEELRMVVNNLYDRWWCEEGPLYTSNLDFIVFIITLVFMILVQCTVVTIVQMHRFATVLKVKHFVDAPDRRPGKYSKLVVYRHDRRFVMLGRSDIQSYIGQVALLPRVKFFWRVWRMLRAMRRGCLACFYGSGAEGFHALDSERLLSEATLKLQRSNESSTEMMGKLRVQLSPYDLVRVLDVGSGEMGFYSYWLDQATRCIRADGITEPKLKYNKHQTFADHFVTNADGATLLYDEFVQRFKLMATKRQSSWAGRRLSQASPIDALASSSLGGSLGFMSPLRGAAAGGRGGGEEASLADSLGSLPNAPMPEDPLLSSPEGSPKRPNTAASTTSPAEEERQPVLMCLTGANRQMLRDDAEGREQLDIFVKAVNKLISRHHLQCILFSPRDVDEAMYELWATEWVVQHGDLDVSAFKLDTAYRTLQGGRQDAMASWDDVMAEYGDLRSEAELRAAFRRSRDEALVPAETPPSSPSRAVAALAAARASLAATAPPGGGGGCGSGGGGAGTEAQAQRIGSHTTSQDGGGLPHAVSCAAFYRAFEASAPLLRALLRARLFAGTLSAGSGSSQVTLRRAESLDSSQVHSIPLGNRTPLVTMKITAGHEEALFSKHMPETRKLARELLCGPGPVKETRPAWPEDGAPDAKRLQLWKELVSSCAVERGFPIGQRGLFVGISAVYYAAAEANCDGKVLTCATFLELLERRSDELRKGGGGNGRALANLTLVISLVETVLHPTALIVCKRKWTVGESRGEPPVDFIATWTLGLYLKHSGVLGIPLTLAD